MEQPAPVPGPSTKPPLNINVGLVGHIDSGKTSLAKALSTHASTAAFDKNPQSQQRGITIDLGFSSFSTPVPAHLSDQPFSSIQYTIVDCPGHASYIRTVLGGAQIIDLMILVIDITKGVQTQTAEGLVIGDITTSKMLVVLNKIDQIEEAKREAHVNKLEKGLRKVLSTTKFADAPIVTASAVPKPDIERLLAALAKLTTLPARKKAGPLVMSVDHCFPIKGQGSVLTGTVLSGSVKVGDTVELPELKVEKKVKSLQVFHKPVQEAFAGDRVGMCVTQLDTKLVERALVATPKTVPQAMGIILSAHKVAYFKLPITNKQKFHVSVAHATVMATPLFFKRVAPKALATPASKPSGPTPAPAAVTPAPAATAHATPPPALTSASPVPVDFSFDHEFVHCTELKEDSDCFCLLRLETPVFTPIDSLLIASKLDTDVTANMCRLAFYGRILQALENLDDAAMKRLKVFKEKTKEGQIERVNDEHTAIGRNLFQKEVDLNLFVGMKIELETGEQGTIEGSFGKSGKFKLRFPRGGLKEETHRNKKIIFRYKRFLFDPTKHLVQ